MISKQFLRINSFQGNANRFLSQSFVEIRRDDPKDVFPDIEAKQLKRGTGGRSSFSGQIVTVFGGGGFVGRYVINKLAKTGSQIVVPFRGDFQEVQRLKVCGDLGQVVFSRFNLKDSESIYKSMKYSNVVINLIGKDTQTNNFDFQAVHVDGAQTIARIAKEVGIKRFVHLSALNSTPNPEPQLLRKGSQWLRSKYFGELAVREEFPLATIIKAADIHGTDDNFTQYFCRWQRRQLGKMPLINGGFGTFKNPVFVSDVAQAIVNAITDDESPGQTYAAIGPRKYEMRALIEYIQRIIQKTPEYYFYVTNLKWSPLFLLRVILFSNPKWLRKYPEVSLEKLEREAISDFLPEGIKTIEDLGIKLTLLEDKLEHNLKHWKRLSYYGEEVGEFPELEKPEVIRV